MQECEIVKCEKKTGRGLFSHLYTFEKNNINRANSVFYLLLTYIGQFFYFTKLYH